MTWSGMTFSAGITVNGLFLLAVNLVDLMTILKCGRSLLSFLFACVSKLTCGSLSFLFKTLLWGERKKSERDEGKRELEKVIVEKIIAARPTFKSHKNYVIIKNTKNTRSKANKIQ